ncbi:MAG TPA: YbhB/YbcL family Raf kinase inhibitor-like protein, partial [Gammaproteobacteria bacterium]|nr:YbhB/YbcL family Raf kinase inhibitor-like protein [Gammaproteobacteria bacterium]
MRFLILISLLWINNTFASDFNLQSVSFKNNALIPSIYSCKGEDRSPAFSWSNAPPLTKSFVFIVEDPDAPLGTWYHWVIFNIPSNITSITENTMPSNSVNGVNSWGKNHYNGPCPPPGQMHHYIFTLYALDTMLDLTKDAKAVDVK